MNDERCSAEWAELRRVAARVAYDGPELGPWERAFAAALVSLPEVQPEAWSRRTAGQRLDVLRRIEVDVALAQHRTPALVRTFADRHETFLNRIFAPWFVLAYNAAARIRGRAGKHLSDSRGDAGGWDPASVTIHLHQEMLGDAGMALEVFGHEDRHAQQWAAIDHGTKDGTGRSAPSRWVRNERRYHVPSDYAPAIPVVCSVVSAPATVVCPAAAIVAASIATAAALYAAGKHLMYRFQAQERDAYSTEHAIRRAYGQRVRATATFTSRPSPGTPTMNVQI